MILKNQYPICEFDTSKKPMIQAAALFAVSQYHNIPLAQLLYAGDDVSGEVWDSRNWKMQKNVRYHLITFAIEIVRKL
ncbi:MAG: hypothetical protein NC417_05760 [Candidatus Gastranaerophilales bacterium]|nr:hypothetical protein [Candidatus Gastranaerophilales bacterium]